MVAPPSVAETKSNSNAHLQTFPYPTIPRSFSNSNVLMTKWRLRTLSLKSMTEKQAIPEKDNMVAENWKIISFLAKWPVVNKKHVKQSQECTVYV